MWITIFQKKVLRVLSGRRAAKLQVLKVWPNGGSFTGHLAYIASSFIKKNRCFIYTIKLRYMERKLPRMFSISDWTLELKSVNFMINYLCKMKGRKNRKTNYIMTKLNSFPHFWPKTSIYLRRAEKFWNCEFSFPFLMVSWEEPM